MNSGIEVIYEDNHLIAVNKQNNELVQGDKTGDVSLDHKIKSYLKKKYHKPGAVFLGVIHRIDRPVSGIVLFARTSKALSRMNKLFNEKSVKKTYWAIVKNKPPQREAFLVHYLVRNPAKNKSFAYDAPKKDSKKAEMTYRLLGASASFYLLEIELITGRHHQIRTQLYKTGCPIRGDLKYGYPRSNKQGGISLHARKLEFQHPVTGERVVLVAPCPPDDIWDKFSFR